MPLPNGNLTAEEIIDTFSFDERELPCPICRQTVTCDEIRDERVMILGTVNCPVVAHVDHFYKYNPATGMYDAGKTEDCDINTEKLALAVRMVSNSQVKGIG